MKTSDFDYHLPPDFIAQQPLEPRDASRLLVLDRQKDRLAHAHFYQLGDYLRPKDLLVLNETRVIPARLIGRKIPSGGKVELLLLRREGERVWEAMVGGKGLVPGKRIQLEGDVIAEILADLDGPRRLVRFDRPLTPELEKIGAVPLPPYIHRKLEDAERYQTVYAQSPGSAAAPTAGLHFTPQLLARLAEQGVRFAKVTLHVGLDTFAPVTEDSPQDHAIHTEWRQVSAETAEMVNDTRRMGGRVIAVGTTSVRTLESAADSAAPGETIGAVEGQTDLFILPGYRFRVVDAMITNFHLPRSTLIMLVSAFAGRERTLSAYRQAVEAGYRFYSFGDAMLIL